ncbi:hypothetical protein D3C85_512930 [compost metagenome]
MTLFQVDVTELVRHPIIGHQVNHVYTSVLARCFDYLHVVHHVPTSHEVWLSVVQVLNHALGDGVVVGQLMYGNRHLHDVVKERWVFASFLVLEFLDDLLLPINQRQLELSDDLLGEVGDLRTPFFSDVQLNAIIAYSRPEDRTCPVAEHVGLGVDHGDLVRTEGVRPLLSVGLLHEDFRTCIQTVEVRTARQHLHAVCRVAEAKTEADVLTQVHLCRLEHVHTSHVFELDLVRVSPEVWLGHPVRPLEVLAHAQVRDTAPVFEDQVFLDREHVITRTLTARSGVGNVLTFTRYDIARL